MANLAVTFPDQLHLMQLILLPSLSNNWALCTHTQCQTLEGTLQPKLADPGGSVEAPGAARTAAYATQGRSGARRHQVSSKNLDPFTLPFATPPNPPKTEGLLPPVTLLDTPRRTQLPLDSSCWVSACAPLCKLPQAMLATKQDSSPCP